MTGQKTSVRHIWRALGPGLITGAADDDPSGIATYSQAGAQFGFSLLWTLFLTLPFMAAIQIISACIGWDTRKGLSSNIARVLPPVAVYPLVASLLVANTINIAADLAAMGEALRLVVGGSALAFAVLFGIVCLTAEVFIPYHRYAGYLKFLTMVLLFYVAAAFSVHIPWGEVLYATVAPKVRQRKLCGDIMVLRWATGRKTLWWSIRLDLMRGSGWPTVGFLTRRLCT